MCSFLIYGLKLTHAHICINVSIQKSPPKAATEIKSLWLRFTVSSTLVARLAQHVGQPGLERSTCRVLGVCLCLVKTSVYGFGTRSLAILEKKRGEKERKTTAKNLRERGLMPKVETRTLMFLCVCMYVCVFCRLCLCSHGHTYGR